MNRLPDGGFEIGRLSFDTAETVMTTGVLTADGILVPSGGVLGVPFAMTGVLFGETVNGIGLASAGLVGGGILSVGYVFAAAPPGGPAIPEPGTWLLLMSGLSTLTLWRYRVLIVTSVLNL
jgi:hypothetical protein